MNKITLLLAFFIIGVAFRSFFDFGVVFIGFLGLLFIALLCIGVLFRERVVVFASLSILFIALGIARFDIVESRIGDPVLDLNIEQSVLIEGVISGEPDERDARTKIIVSLEYIHKEEEKTPITAKVIATIERFPEFSYGDRVILKGEINKPKNFSNEETGRVFNYIAFLGKKGVAYQMFYPEVELIGVGEGSFIREKLFIFKQSFIERIGLVLQEPHSSLLGGIIIGAKQSLGPQLLEDFRTTGIIHIVVLSGYNVTIVAEAMMRFFAFLPFMASLSLSAISIVLFAVMAGAGAPVVRASIMALLVILARATGRVHDIKRALFVAGFLMVVHNPKILIFDVSFQLSFIATLGLICASPIVEKRLSITPNKLGLRQIAAATIATQIFVLPLLLFYMGKFSLVAIPVNLLVLITIPAVMFFGFLAGLLGFVHFTASMVVGTIAYFLLEYILLVVAFFVQVPFAAVFVPHFPILAVFISYAILWILIQKPQWYFYIKNALYSKKK